MNPRKTAIKDLNNSGYTFKRSGGNHDIYKELCENNMCSLLRIFLCWQGRKRSHTEVWRGFLTQSSGEKDEQNA